MSASIRNVPVSSDGAFQPPSDWLVGSPFTFFVRANGGAGGDFYQRPRGTYPGGQGGGGEGGTLGVDGSVIDPANAATWPVISGLNQAGVTVPGSDGTAGANVTIAALQSDGVTWITSTFVGGGGGTVGTSSGPGADGAGGSGGDNIADDTPGNVGANTGLIAGQTALGGDGGHSGLAGFPAYVTVNYQFTPPS